MNLIDKDKIVSDLQKVLGITDEQIEKGGINADIIDSANPLIGGFLQYILNLPTIDAVEVVHGKWEERYIEDANPLFRRRFYCSRCGNWTTYGKTLYCPNCGAKMDGEEQNDDTRESNRDFKG